MATTKTGGLYWIVAGLALGGLGFGIAAFFSGKSGSTIQVGTGTPDVHVIDAGRNAPNTGFLIFAAVLIVAAIVVYFVVKADYRKPKASDQANWDKNK